MVSVLDFPARLVCLVKPQFELGREYVGKGGVVREREDQLKAVELVTAFGVEMGLRLLGCRASPLPGAKKGNQEYFVCFAKDC